jgi:hypothetical protein
MGDGNPLTRSNHTKLMTKMVFESGHRSFRAWCTVHISNEPITQIQGQKDSRWHILQEGADKIHKIFSRWKAKHRGRLGNGSKPGCHLLHQSDQPRRSQFSEVTRDMKISTVFTPTTTRSGGGKSGLERPRMLDRGSGQDRQPFRLFWAAVRVPLLLPLILLPSTSPPQCLSEWYSSPIRVL